MRRIRLVLIGLLLLTMAWNGAAQRVLRIEADAWIIGKFPVREAAERFMQDHPDVKVEVKAKDYKDFVQTYLLMWSENRTTVDLGIGGMAMQLAPLVGADLLIDLGDVLMGPMAKDRFVDSFLSAARFVGKDGQAYYPVLPFMGEVMTLNVNKTFWDKIGALDEQGSPKAPKDWDELEDLLTKLTQAAPAQGLSVDWGWNFILYSYAGGILALKGDIYGPEGSMLDVESDAALRWLEMNRRWIEKGIAAEGTITDVNFGRDNFNAGIIPMIYTAHSRFIEGGADLGEENTSAIPLPGALDNGTIVYTHTIYVPKASSNQDLAKQFIQEQIFSKWFQQWSYNRYGKLPVITEFYEDLGWYVDEAAMMLKMAENGVYMPKYRGSEELLDIFLEHIHGVLLGLKSPAEGLAAIRKDIETRKVDLTRLDI